MRLLHNWFRNALRLFCFYVFLDGGHNSRFVDAQPFLYN